jgi:hypothetical protein
MFMPDYELVDRHRPLQHCTLFPPRIAPEPGADIKLAKRIEQFLERDQGQGVRVVNAARMRFVLINRGGDDRQNAWMIHHTILGNSLTQIVQ